MLAIVIQKGRRIQSILHQEKYRIIRLACLVAGTLLFLTGCVINQLGAGRSWTSGLICLTGGVTSIGSAFLVFKKVPHVGYVGYATIEQEM
jgi:hypothetical protein